MRLEGKLFGKAVAVGAEDADGVRFIEKEQGSAVFLEGDDVGKGAKVAIHGEDGLGDDQGTTFTGVEEFLKFMEIVVGEDAKGGAGEPGGIDQAGMGELIDDDGVALADNGRDGAHGGGVAVGESEGGFGFLSVGDFFFESMVEIERSADEAGGGGSGAVVGEGPGGGLDEGGVLGEAEVVV